MASKYGRTINIDDLKQHVDHLKIHNDQEKIPISICGKDLLNYCKENSEKDYLFDRNSKINPFTRESSCIFLI